MHNSGKEAEKGPGLGEALLVLARRWAIEPEVMTRLIGKSETFREICTDYQECCAKLVQLEKKGATVSEQVSEYVEMRNSLERDLLRCLDAGGCREWTCSTG